MKFTVLLLFCGLLYILGLIEFVIRIFGLLSTFGLICVAEENFVREAFAWNFAQSLSKYIAYL